MDKELAEKNRRMQDLISKETTFKEGISLLKEMRKDLKGAINWLWNLPDEAFYQMPYAKAKGYHNKTIAYSVWHMMRIEDIVAHTLILENEEILFRDGFHIKTCSPIITTGNELKGQEIADFSKQLNLKALQDYAMAVMESTDKLLDELTFADLKRKVSDTAKKALTDSHCVSDDEEAVWLIDYWCNKNVLGLIKMPFSRHLIMHVEAAQRIKNKLAKDARNGVDPVAYCGFSCNHCFLGQWCGSCRTEYNICSFATIFENKTCPNVECCRQKGLDGCYECDEIMDCTKGFYTPDNDGAAAAKAQALYIRKYGKKEFLKCHDILHETHDFAKTQEILGQSVENGLEIMEKAREM